MSSLKSDVAVNKDGISVKHKLRKIKNLNGKKDELTMNSNSISINESK